MRYKSIFLLLVFLIPAIAYATTPKSIIVFGESFSDSGNLYHLYDDWGLEPDTWGWFTNNRIGNGSNWADYLADHYKQVPPLEASSYGGTNYAIGGADSSFGPGVWGFGSTGQQVMQFLDDTGSIHGRGNVLIVYFIGGNDILTGQDLSVTMDNISIQLGMLIDAGALHFLVPNMIPLGMTPDGLAGGGGLNILGYSSAELNSMTVTFNEALMTLLREIKCSNPSVHLYTVNTHQLMLDVLADPLAFGFENITEPVTWYGGDPEVSLWWDGVHQTSHFQSLVADIAAAAVDHSAGGLNCQFVDE